MAFSLTFLMERKQGHFCGAPMLEPCRNAGYVCSVLPCLKRGARVAAIHHHAESTVAVDQKGQYR